MSFYQSCSSCPSGVPRCKFHDRWRSSNQIDYCDISVAVSGPKGLMVPVVRHAEELSFRGVEAEIKRLAIRARDGQITVDEMTGGTFTISNGGVLDRCCQHPLLIHHSLVF